MKNMTLENIAAACGGTYVGDEKLLKKEICGAVTDSREIKKDYLFIPIKGARVDGHKFIPDVFEKGALATLSERDLTDAAEPYIRVDSSEAAMKKIAEFYRKNLDIPIIGITGSVGKTSTKEMVASVLGQRYNVLRTDGNFNNEIGLPLTIFRIKEEHEAAVLEMGISDFGEMHRLAKMAQPNIGIITNIGLCHLEKLGSRDGILQAKTEMFEHLAPRASVILNGDDDKLSTKKEVNGKPVIFYGMEPGGLAEKSVYATDIKNFGLDGTEAKIHTPQGDFLAHIPLPGTHQAYNALAATAAGLLLGLELSEIEAGIADVSAIAGRSNIIEIGGVTIIDDCYNANPVSMAASLDVLGHTAGRRIAVLGDMGELGEDARELHRGVGVAVKEADIDTLFAVGDMAQGYADEASCPCTVFRYDDAKSAVAPVCNYVKPGDVVLVKASHFMEFPQIVDALRKSLQE